MTFLLLNVLKDKGEKILELVLNGYYAIAALSFLILFSLLGGG